MGEEITSLHEWAHFAGLMEMSARLAMFQLDLEGETYMKRGISRIQSLRSGALQATAICSELPNKGVGYVGREKNYLYRWRNIKKCLC
ncbi:hypothetical protein CYL77_02230 [Corynebacterium glutamicum]|nr:hypothetical protein B7P23_10765 [Corynebacterium glutamicum]AUI00036.1 hypothetical protein CYL77_02230 [Corynebacterium glutamicum]AUI03673.1 hypothetical protein C0I99_05915 [Corynebacterium glutamicum]